MRTGLYGIASTQEVQPFPEGKGVVDEGCHISIVMEEPRHAIQQGCLHLTEGCLFGAHGVWLNAEHPDWSSPAHLEELEHTVSEAVTYASVEGPLQAVHWSAATRTLQLHVDFARQHPLFWTKWSSGIVFAYSMDMLVSLMRRQDLEVLPDEESAAMLLTFGSIMGDGTLIQGVKKLMPGHTLTWTPDAVVVEERLPLADIERDITDTEESTDVLDEAFRLSVAQMVQANQYAGCDQHNLLSGGLDSRLVALATAQGLEGGRLSTLCFSAKGARDESISAALAERHGWTHRFHDLQEGGYMTVTDSVFEYDGCVNFLASAHHREALKAHPLPKLGLLGSGQGANVLLTDNHKWASSGSEVLRSMRLYAGVNEWARRSAKAAWEACGDVQTFRVVNRGFLYTNSGANSTAAFGVLWSPFVSAQFVRAALRLAPSLIEGQRAYLTWLAERFPQAAEHVWERYNARPVLGWRLRLAQTMALWKARFWRVWPWNSSASMSPVEHWMSSSSNIQHFYRDTFRRLSPLLSHYPHLRGQVERDYPNMSAVNKASVLTLLLATESWIEP